ncbi:MAG TPA: hypothetical protein VHB21_19840, partial [Minicystis sp.]|nr:hypothetical protein [Minicystis sp.]
LERRPYFEEPQLYYVVGAEELLRVKVAKLPQLPKWHQLRIIDEFGAVRAPGAARVIAALLPSRSAGAAAAAGLDARRAFVDEEVLPALDAGDPATSAAIRAHFGGAAPAPKRTKKQLEAELRDVLASVGPALVAAGRDEAKERAVLAGAFARYCEIRAALEEVIPEAYFTHMLGEHVPAWKVDRETSMRWMELAVDVAV